MTLQSNQLIGFGAGGVGVITMTFEAQLEDGTDLTTYTFSTADLGAAGAKKIIIGVGASAGNSTLIVSTITVDGESASLVKAQASPTETAYRAEIWECNTATAATGDIVVTFNGASNLCGIAIFRAANAEATSHATAGDNADPSNATLDIPAGGIAIGMAYANTAGKAWTNLTEDFESTVEGAENYTGASDSFVAMQTARSITCTYTGSPSRFAMALASWGPT